MRSFVFRPNNVILAFTVSKRRYCKNSIISLRGAERRFFLADSFVLCKNASIKPKFIEIGEQGASFEEKTLSKYRNSKYFIRMLNSRNSIDSLNSTSARSSRERKSCLKHALQRTLALQEMINDSRINKLDEAINEADHVTYETSIQEKVSNQQEVLIDSQMMTSSSKVLKTCTISLTKRMRDYNHIDFSQKLINHLQETSEESQSPNWSLLERRVTKLFKRIANNSTLLGTLDPLEKKTIVRKKPEQRVASQVAVTVPNKLVPHANTKDEDSVERTVRKIKKLITCYCKESGKPLDFFQLILHPHDFGRTIRNMLYISFLVKDGVVKLKKDHRNLVVEPCRREVNAQEKQSSNKIGIQHVTSLEMKQWRILKKTYRLEQPMIDFDEEK